MKDMKNMNKFYKRSIFVALVIILAFFCRSFWVKNNDLNTSDVVYDTNFGSFLAAQHALYVNDFDAAVKLFKNVDADANKIDTVKHSRDMINFLTGKIPEDVESIKDFKDLENRLIYDAALLHKDDWKTLYKRHEKDDSVFMAPLRVFSAVHEGKSKEAIQYVNSLKTNSSWKAFVRGQIALLTDDLDTAIKEFANVHPDFMNINDYLYLMSFYKEHQMFEDMDILRDDFLAKPTGMFVLNYDDIPDWSNYTGYKNNLAFSIVQNISHTQIMIFTDFALMMLKFAALIASDANQDAVNYYLGQYYFYNAGDFVGAFNSVSEKNPLYLFGQMRIAESNHDIQRVKKIAEKNPLFVPAVKIAITYATRNGNKRDALQIVNHALKQENLGDNGRILFLKHRANIYLLFNQPDKAQRDLDEIQDINDSLVPDILLLQARTWMAQNRNLDRAYDYAMQLIKRNTSDVIAWDILGLIVEKREGLDPALELLERIGDVSSTTSSLYEHLGDMHKKKGNKEKAIKAYSRALDLSDDGMIVVPFVEKKLRKLK
ncbi:MAG: hypothetical protein J6S57_00395 [Alphaproteobacteria bacterium]|nr:hypothetical protein [Alphaproteobacteria bacterium]